MDVCMRSLRCSTVCHFVMTMTKWLLWLRTVYVGRVHTRTDNSHLQPSRDFPPLVGVSIGANNWIVHDLQAIYRSVMWSWSDDRHHDEHVLLYVWCITTTTAAVQELVASSWYKSILLTHLMEHRKWSGTSLLLLLSFFIFVLSNISIVAVVVDRYTRCRMIS